MPAIISHYLLARRVLATAGMPRVVDRDAFLLGAQGPDIFFFFRAFPWQHGKKGLPLGNALHEVRPSVLFDAWRAVIAELPAKDRPIAESYLLGFLCHYAADRTVHPYVMATQEVMRAADPSYADNSNPYHYRIESAIDTLLLRRDTGEFAAAYPLIRAVPKRDEQRDRIIATVYHRLLSLVLNVPRSSKELSRLTADMRQAMRLMTDRVGFKRAVFRLLERFSKHGAWYSSLIRTDDVAWYDFMNEEHREWLDGDGTRTDDVYTLCDAAVSLAVSLANAWTAEEDGLALTEDMDFTGKPYTEKEKEL